MRITLIILLLLAVCNDNIFAQVIIKGIVLDKNQKPIFAANIFEKSDSTNYTASNFDGEFRIHLKSEKSTLIISHIGYITTQEYFYLSSLDTNNTIIIVLDEANISLNEVVVRSKDPISKQVSVSKIGRFDIYMTPISQGDPLKAITILPSSTTTDESANPSLRGSSPGRSIVALNGVPIYNPVRSTQLNNQGFFSLFNTEMIENEYVYSGNPPLTYGNTSAGLVDIETSNSLDMNQLQMSIGLGSVGAFVSQKIDEDKTFVQAYTNYQFSEALTGIQKKSYPDINNFKTIDAGVSLFSKLSPHLELKSYTYFLDERFNGYSNSYAYDGEVSSLNQRLFTVNSFKFRKGNSVIDLNTGFNFAKPNIEYGNIVSDNKNSQVYASLNYKLFLLNNLVIQFGGSFEYHKNKYNDSIPTYYYAIRPDDPSYYIDELLENRIFEAYGYTNWNINKTFSLSAGIRTNIPLNHQKYYLSSQLALRYNINHKQYMIFSAGKYHSYTVPSYYSNKINLLSSDQISLDYAYEFSSSMIKAATYFKREAGDQSLNSFNTPSTSQINIFGVELFWEQNFKKYFKFTLSNTFMQSRIEINNKMYKASNNLNYFVKSMIEYNNPKLFAVSLIYIGRPGSRYHPITGSVFVDKNNSYMPLYGDWYGAQYSSYNKFDLTINKYIPMKKSALVIYATLNNIFNNKNERNDIYNRDYSTKSFDYYQLRSIYFGIVWHFNYSLK